MMMVSQSKLTVAILVAVLVYGLTYICTPKTFNTSYEAQEHLLMTCSIGWIIGSIVNAGFWYLGL